MELPEVVRRLEDMEYFLRQKIAKSVAHNGQSQLTHDMERDRAALDVAVEMLKAIK